MSRVCGSLVVAASALAMVLNGQEKAHIQPPSAQAPKVTPKSYKLKAPSKTQLDTSREAAKRRGVGLQGVHLDLDAKALDKGKWHKLPDGRSVWLLRIESPGATAMRFHFLKFDAGQGQVWVHQGKESYGPYTGKGPNGDGEFWSDIVQAPSATLEYLPQAGVKPSGKPPFQVDKVSHQLTN